ncbi:hypothetical protein, partial [Pseudomonas brenneri]|uniref:hypothetical protein n=1 Tax=Pseudomonas brenneri TaxID=129817 RepID=UPI0028D56816
DWAMATPPDKHLFETYVSPCAMSSLQVRFPAGQSPDSHLFNHIFNGLLAALSQGFARTDG